MSAPGQAPPMPRGPGFITVILDIPFSLAIPNGQYSVFDPVKGMAIVQPVMKEGSRTFFRDTPITGPTSFDDLKCKAQEYERPRLAHSYVVVSGLTDGTQKATLNIHSGAGGGFAEAKYYTEVQVTYLEDDLGVLSRQDGSVLQRTTDILNRFLDKYRLFTEDYRVGRVSSERNFYFAVCHTSPLTPEEQGLSTPQLFATLSNGRTFLHQLGHGGGNILRQHSLEHLGPRSQLANEALRTLTRFLQTDYEMPLSYDLILEAYRSLQLGRDYKLTIVHAATAVEVHVLHLLLGVLVASGETPADTWTKLENDPEYEGVSKRLKRLETHTKSYCEQNGLFYAPFVGGALYDRWKRIVAGKRNRAVHAGVAGFTWIEAAEAIATAKEAIVFLDQRIPTLSNYFQLSPDVRGIRESAGGILF
jgi:hypothetical protein